MNVINGNATRTTQLPNHLSMKGYLIILIIDTKTIYLRTKGDALKVCEENTNVEICTLLDRRMMNMDDGDGDGALPRSKNDEHDNDDDGLLFC